MKKLFKALLSCTVAVSCLIGVCMTSLAVETEGKKDFTVGTIYYIDNVIEITQSEIGIKTTSYTTYFLHAEDKLTVALQDNEGSYSLGFNVIQNGVSNGFMAIDLPDVDETTAGVKVISGNGSSSDPYVFRRYNPDTEDADIVIDLINALPDPEAVTASDEDAITNALNAYAEIAEDYEGYISQEIITKLEECEEALEDELADKKVADVVQALVDELPEPEKVTEDDRADIEAAREAFSELTDNQKQYVNINKLIEDEIQLDKNKAAVVVDLIDAIGEVELTDECEARIRAARSAYEELTDDERRHVDNFNDMTAAEEEYLALCYEAAVKELEDAVKDLPDADKLTVDDLYDVYSAAYMYDELPDNVKGNVDADTMKKLNAVVGAMYVIATDVEEQMCADYREYLGEEYYEYFMDAVEDAKNVIASGKQPTCTQLQIMFVVVIATDFKLYNTYIFISGADSDWVLGSPDSLIFRIFQAGIDSENYDDTFYNFLNAGGKIYVDGTLVDTKYYTAEKGSVILTLIPDFLNTLSVGEHTLTVLFDNSVSVSTKFTVSAPAAIPSSGESVSHYVILGVSVILLAGAVLVMRKRMFDSVK